MINNDTLIVALQFINDSILLFVDLKKGLWQYNINSKQVSILSIYPRTLGNNIIYSWIKNRNDIYLIPGSGGIVVKNGQPLYKGTQTEMLYKNITNDYIFILDSTGVVNVYDSNGNFLKKSSKGYSSVWYIVKYNKDNYILSSSYGIYNYNISSNIINTIIDTPNIYGRPRGIYVENTCIILGKQKVGRYSYYSPLSNIYFNAVGSLNFKTKFPFYRTYDGYLSIRSASKIVEGIVKIGNNINIDTFGTISVNLPFVDTTRFVGDSIRWDTAIANRVISQRIDTNLNRIYYKKTNGKIDSLQLRLSANASGASINNDSILHPYPYPYKDTINFISTTDKVVNLGTNNKALINFNESIKVTQLFSSQTNVNGNARNGKFVRYGNTFQTFAGNVLLSSSNGSTFTQLSTSQIMSGNNQYNTIEAMDLTGDSLVVLTSAGGGNYILCILGSLGSTILYRSASFTISDGSGSFVTDVSKIQLLGTSLYAVNGASFNNYLIKINIVNLSNQTIATTGSPAAFFKSTTNLYFLDYSGWYYEINAPTTRILKISNNAVTDATLLENRYICVSDYTGNIYVADMTTNKVVDYIVDVYFGSSDISVYAFGNILYIFDGTATTLYVTANQFSFNNLIVNTLAPFMFNSSLLDSAGNSGIAGQTLLSQNGKVVWGTPTQTYPLRSVLIWSSTAAGAAQNPALSFQSNALNLTTSGTGVTLPAGTYDIFVKAGMPGIDAASPFPVAYFKFGITPTIDAGFPTLNELKASINKGTSGVASADVLNGSFSDNFVLTQSAIYYLTTFINRTSSAGMSGFVIIVRTK